MVKCVIDGKHFHLKTSGSRTEIAKAMRVMVVALIDELRYACYHDMGKVSHKYIMDNLLSEWYDLLYEIETMDCDNRNNWGEKE